MYVGQYMITYIDSIEGLYGRQDIYISYIDSIEGMWADRTVYVNIYRQ